MFIVEVRTWSKPSVCLSSVMLMNVGKSRNHAKKSKPGSVVSFVEK